MREDQLTSLMVISKPHIFKLSDNILLTFWENKSNINHIIIFPPANGRFLRPVHRMFMYQPLSGWSPAPTIDNCVLYMIFADPRHVESFPLLSPAKVYVRTRLIWSDPVSCFSTVTLVSKGRIFHFLKWHIRPFSTNIRTKCVFFVLSIHDDETDVYCQ